MSVAFWSKKLIVGEAAEVQPPEGYILNLQQATYVSNVKNSAVQLSVKTIAIEGEEVKNESLLLQHLVIIISVSCFFITE